MNFQFLLENALVFKKNQWIFLSIIFFDCFDQPVETLLQTYNNVKLNLVKDLPSDSVAEHAAMFQARSLINDKHSMSSISSTGRDVTRSYLFANISIGTPAKRSSSRRV